MMSDALLQFFKYTGENSFYNFAGSNFGIHHTLFPLWIERYDYNANKNKYRRYGYRYVTTEYVFESLSDEQKQVYIFNLNLMEEVKEYSFASIGNK